MTDFAGRRILITGGASGIGAAAAEAFLRIGARVAIVDIGAAALEARRAALEPLGEVVAIRADVSSEQGTDGYVAQTLHAFGGIDVFVNNAGVEGRVAPIAEQSADDFDRVIAVNLRGCFLGLRAVLPIMSAQGSGSIINTSSAAGLDGAPGLAPYSASKHGVVALTKSAALESAAAGVRVNSIHPSPVDTPMIESIMRQRDPQGSGSARQAFLARIPLGRFAEPDDIAQLIVFLGSDESAFITGAQYRVDGGMGAA